MNATDSRTRTDRRTPVDSTDFPVLLRMPDLRPRPSVAVKSAAVAKKEIASASPTPPMTMPLAEPIAVAITTSPAPLVVKADATLPVASSTTIVQANTTPADVTQTSVATSTVTPAASTARHQRSQERRRRMEETQPEKSWWNTHFPAIFVGFLVALACTFFIARNRNAKPNDAPGEWTAHTPPELSIDPGLPTEVAVPELSLSPPEVVKTPASHGEGPEESPQQVAERPSTSPKLPPLLRSETATTTEASSGELDAPAVESTAEATPSRETTPVVEHTPGTAYPTTEPTVYRAGGRVIRSARAPTSPAPPANNFDYSSEWR